MITVHLPYPPSLNSLYPGKVRRHKSEKYKAWIREAGIMLSQQRRDHFDCPVQVVYRIGRPDNRQRDIANCEKALSDLLVEHKILEDDSLIYRLVMEWADIDGVDATISAL